MAILTAVKETEDSFILSDGTQVAKDGITDPAIYDKLRSEAAYTEPNIESLPMPDPQQQKAAQAAIQPSSVGGGMVGAATALAPGAIGAGEPQTDMASQPGFNMEEDVAAQQLPQAPTGMVVAGGARTSGLPPTARAGLAVQRERLEGRLTAEPPAPTPPPMSPQDQYPDLEQPELEGLGTPPTETQMPRLEDYATPEVTEYFSLRDQLASGNLPTGDLTKGDSTFRDTGAVFSNEVEARMKELEPHYNEALRKTKSAQAAIGPAIEEYEAEKLAWRQEALNTIPGQKAEIIRLGNEADIIQQEKIATMKETHKRIEAEQQAIKEMKVDPRRLYGKDPGIMDFNAMTMMNIGAALMAFGSSITGKGDPYQGLKNIQSMVNRDITLQQNEIARKKAGVADMVNGLDRKNQMFSSEKAAIDMQKASMLQLISIGMKEKAQETADKRAQAAVKYQTDMIDVANERLVQSGWVAERNVWAENKRLKLMEAAGPKKEKQPVVPAEMIKEYGGVLASIKSIKRIQEQYKKVDWTGPISARTPMMQTEAKDYEHQRDILSAQIVKALSGAAATDAERAIIRTFAANPGDTQAMAETKFKNLTYMMTNHGSGMAQALRDTGRSDAADRMEETIKVLGSAGGGSGAEQEGLPTGFDYIE